MKSRIARHLHSVERGRIFAEAIGCLFVAAETHYWVFAAICVVWFVLDTLEIFGGQA